MQKNLILAGPLHVQPQLANCPGRMAFLASSLKPMYKINCHHEPSNSPMCWVQHQLQPGSSSGRRTRRHSLEIPRTHMYAGQSSTTQQSRSEKPPRTVWLEMTYLPLPFEISSKACRPEALDEVESPSIEANVKAEPTQPNSNAVLNLLGSCSAMEVNVEHCIACQLPSCCRDQCLAQHRTSRHSGQGLWCHGLAELP